MITTNEKGNIGLTKVIADVVEKHYFPFLPLSDSNETDLIIRNEKAELRRMQIKYRKIDDGLIALPIETVVNRKKVKIDISKVDIWAVYCPDNGLIYYVPTRELVKRNTTSTILLRVDKPKQEQKSIIYADRFLSLDDAW